jgi:heptosyltransferase-2
LWRRWGLDGARRLILIAPGARSHIKRWTAEGFARVADRLIGETGAHVIFSGESDEEPIVEEIRGLMRHASHSAVGLVTIRQLGLLMARSQLVMTNDSAALHMASALNVPTVAIFGPTDAARYGPTADQRRVVLRRLFCAPCGQSLCRFHHECMRFVTPDEVFGAASKLLAIQHDPTRQAA